MTRKAAVILALFVSSALAGALAPIAATHAAGMVLLIANLAVSSFLLFAWYRFDTEERSIDRSWGLNAAIIGFALVALPYYFLRTRGVARGLLAIAGAIGLLFASTLVSVLVAGVTAVASGA